jgi:hypothetical protein
MKRGNMLTDVVFAFEDVGDDLDLLPLAARRALDTSGLRMSLEAYRTLKVADRKALAMLGAGEQVHVPEVEQLAKKCTLPVTPIKRVQEVDSRNPPDQLLPALAERGLDLLAWRRLRALERYALIHVMRRSGSRSEGRRAARLRLAETPARPRRRRPKDFPALSDGQIRSRDPSLLRGLLGARPFRI